MRHYLRALVMAAFFGTAFLAGCAALDSLFDTSGGKSRAEKMLDQGKDSGLISGRWSEVALAALMAVQNLYLGARKVQTIRKSRRSTVA